jgi:signal transduction histidine kinase
MAVLLFCSQKAIPRDPALLEVFVHVGTQIGRVIERARFQEAFADAILQEQKRISAELHDHIGQEIAGVGLMASALAQKAGAAGGDLPKMTQEVSLGIRRVSDKVRSLAHGLYSLEIDAQGLLPALERLATTTRETQGLHCTATFAGSLGRIDDRTALQLFRIAQEAVTNSVRHARAKEVTIALREERGLLTLAVRDDGVGIDGVPREGKGLGLRIMRNRASEIGAMLTLKGAPGQGTTMTCTLPLVDDGEKEVKR